MALEYFKGEMKATDELVIESIIGSVFRARIADVPTAASLFGISTPQHCTPSIVDDRWVVTYGKYERAVIPRVEGDAFITGRSEFWVDLADDQFAQGFIVQ